MNHNLHTTGKIPTIDSGIQNMQTILRNHMLWNSHRVPFQHFHRRENHGSHCLGNPAQLLLSQTHKNQRVSRKVLMFFKCALGYRKKSPWYIDLLLREKTAISALIYTGLGDQYSLWLLVFYIKGSDWPVVNLELSLSQSPAILKNQCRSNTSVQCSFFLKKFKNNSIYFSQVVWVSFIRDMSLIHHFNQSYI